MFSCRSEVFINCKHFNSLDEILPLTAFRENDVIGEKLSGASTKRDNCARKRNYADRRKFRQKDHHLTVVYVQRLCYPDTKTGFKMHSITAKYGKTLYLVQRTSFTIPLAIACLRMLRRANHRSRDEIFLTKSVLELTVGFETNLQKIFKWKHDHYKVLVIDLCKNIRFHTST